MARRKKQAVSVWQALNEPVVEVTDEAAKGIFLVAAVLLMFSWLAPSFGAVNAVASSPLIHQPINGQATETAYVPLFEPYSYEAVAGAMTEKGGMGATGEKGAPSWYTEISATGASLGDFYHETVTAPFAEAVTELFDISRPVGSITDFLRPGTDAAWNAWLELMADPQM